MTFGRSTAFHRRRASASEALVSKPRNGEADVTVAALRLRIDRLEDVAGVLHVAEGDFFEQAVGIELFRVRRHQDIVV
jgi:hypothetical protein